MTESGENLTVINPQSERSFDANSVPQGVNVLDARRKFEKIANILRISVMVPALACGILSLGPKLVKEITYGAKDLYFLFQYGEFGDFDPSLGADEVAPKNHRALVVIHKGFGLKNDYFGAWHRNEEYLEYLKELDRLVEEYKKNEDLVIMVMQRSDFEKNPPAADPHQLIYITPEDNGAPGFGVTVDGMTQAQDVQGFFTLLRDLGVEELVVAGEFRNACVVQVRYSFEGKGFALVDSELIYPPEDK